MLDIGKETEVAKALLMKMLVRGRTALYWQCRPCFSMHDLPASTVCGPAHLGELRV